ncbi:hypothetical protein ACH35V_13245 [Actinomadura sp. 1N219]|uniref:hypothetical protein n=1 Tax=Actinomadura sp. 1N219 TaxID=3375152 RepID=UPI00378F029A
MAIKINDTRMILTVNDAVIGNAALVDGVWHVSTWPTPLNRHQAITALTIAELLATGHNENDPLVITFREELAHG